MTNRQAAMTYGAIVACAVSIALLVADYPSTQNLLIAIFSGVAFGIGSWLYLERH
jgi:glucose uptake protein GlcU